MTHQDTPRSVMSFLHLHIFNKVESSRVFRQADRSEPENIVDERCSGFCRKDLVIFLEGLRQELPIFLVIMHTVITLKAVNVNSDRIGNFSINWRILKLIHNPLFKLFSIRVAKNHVSVRLKNSISIYKITEEQSYKLKKQC